MLVGIADLFPLFIHTDTDNMDMGIVCIGMFVGDVRLIPIPHLLHITFRQFCQPPVGQPVFRCWGKGKRNPKAELRKVDASLGDVRHQVGNTLKAVLESYRFQTFGEYNALLSTLNIEAKQVRGEYNGTPYTSIVYSVTDDTGKVVSPPFKSSRFGKRFGNEQLEKRMLINLKALKDGKWAPSIQADIVRALRQADSQKRFVELLGQRRIDVVFRKNERGRIYGVTFIDHNHREVFNGSRMGKVFSANVFNDYFKWLENIPEKERGGHSATELWQHHRHESSSTLELAAGIFSLETNPRDYEEEAFARRMKKKKKTGRKRGI